MTENQHSQSNLSILVLGTGGTIAGLGGDSYLAAQLPIDSLVPASQHQITTEQLAQIDSKDMSFDVWQQLGARLSLAIQDDAVGAVVITHGTDTLEETAYFLHRTLRCTKTIILTGAMRPADSPESDGPHNLAEAFKQASLLAAGVWVVFAGRVLPALGVQKLDPTALDAFQVREVKPLVRFEQSVQWIRPIPWWPRVEIVMNYAGAGGELVVALVAQAVDGIVVAGTGNGTVSAALEASLHMACKAGIAVCLTTRCLQGSVVKNDNHAFNVLPLSPVQARIELILQLMHKLDV